MIDTHLTIINSDQSYENHIFKNTLIHIDCLKSNIFKLPNGKLFNGNNYNLSYQENKPYSYIAGTKITEIDLSFVKNKWNHIAITIDIYGISLETPILSNVLIDTGSHQLVIPATCFKDISNNYKTIKRNVKDGWGNSGYLQQGPISLKTSDSSFITINTVILALQYQGSDTTSKLIPCLSSNWSYGPDKYANNATFGVFTYTNDDSSNYLYNLIKSKYRYKYYEINNNKLLLHNSLPKNIYEISLARDQYDTPTVDVSTIIISSYAN